MYICMYLRDKSKCGVRNASMTIWRERLNAFISSCEIRDAELGTDEYNQQEQDEACCAVDAVGLMREFLDLFVTTPDSAAFRSSAPL